MLCIHRHANQSLSISILSILFSQLYVRILAFCFSRLHWHH